MASYGTSSPSVLVEYTLNKLHLPRSQVEAIPDVEDHSSEDDSSSINPSSLRANFMPPGMEFSDIDPTSIHCYDCVQDKIPYFSPVFSHLASIKHENLTIASQQAQNLRRKLMRSANVLIVQGGYIGKKFIYDTLKKRGVNVFILDGPNSVWRSVAEEGGITEFIELDFTENDTIFERAMHAVTNPDLDVKFDAVTTYYEDAVALAARIATTLGIETNSVESCDKARNKRKTREVMAAAGLPSPRHKKVMCIDDIKTACDFVGFPVILKPVYGASSMGVVKAETLKEATEAYKKLHVTMRTDKDTIWAQGTEMMIEEYYDGDEFDIDLLLSDSVVVYAKVADNWACWEPWFQETGINGPSLYPERKQKELIKLASDATLELGFRYGCFHVECRYTAHGPRLVEVNARMGGVSVRDLNYFVWGVDLVEEHCMAALRIPIRPMLPEKPLRFMAESAINAPYSGVLNSDEWLKFAEENPMVYKVSYFMHKGEKVVGPEDGVPDWIGEIVVICDTSAKDAIRHIQEMVMSQAQVPITASKPGSERGFFFPDHAFPFC